MSVVSISCNILMFCVSVAASPLSCSPLHTSFGEKLVNLNNSRFLSRICWWVNSGGLGTVKKDLAVFGWKIQGVQLRYA